MPFSIVSRSKVSGPDGVFLTPATIFEMIWTETSLTKGKKKNKNYKLQNHLYV